MAFERSMCYGGRLVRDGQPGINQMIFSTKLGVEVMHIDSSFIELDVWIMDMENC